MLYQEVVVAVVQIFATSSSGCDLTWLCPPPPLSGGRVYLNSWFKKGHFITVGQAGSRTMRHWAQGCHLGLTLVLWAPAALGSPASPALLPAAYVQFSGPAPLYTYSFHWWVSTWPWRLCCNLGSIFQLHAMTSQDLLAGSPSLPHTAWHRQIYGTPI